MSGDLIVGELVQVSVFVVKVVIDAFGFGLGRGTPIVTPATIIVVIVTDLHCGFCLQKLIRGGARLFAFVLIVSEVE